MGCAVALQNQAVPGILTVASNMSSREGAFEIEVWADPVEMVETSRENTEGVPKKTLAEKVRSHRHSRGKENGEPSGHVDMTEPCREIGGGYGIFKQRLAEKAHLHRHIQDKENVNPSGLLDFHPSSLPTWHQRYPLKDITALIHSLQGFQVDIDAGLASSGRSELEGLKECCHVLPALCKNTNKKSAQLLRMR